MRATRDQAAVEARRAAAGTGLREMQRPRLAFGGDWIALASARGQHVGGVVRGRREAGAAPARTRSEAVAGGRTAAGGATDSRPQRYRGCPVVLPFWLPAEGRAEEKHLLFELIASRRRRGSVRTTAPPHDCLNGRWSYCCEPGRLPSTAAIQTFFQTGRWILHTRCWPRPGGKLYPAP